MPSLNTTPSAIPESPNKSESLWKLGGLTPWQLTKNVIRESANDGLLERASALGFDFFVALFPLLFFLLTMFGLFASHSAELQASLLAYFADFLPRTGFEMLRTVMNELAANASSGRLTFGILIAFWFASGGVVSIISTLNTVYGVPETRSWFKVRAIALGLTFAFSILILGAVLIVFAGARFVDWVGWELHLGSAAMVVWKDLQWPAAILFMIAPYSIIYYFGPAVRHRRWHWVSPGSVFGVFLWLAASGIFRIYLHYFDTYSTTYGSLGALTILLVWLYVTGLAFLIGGEVNAQIEAAIMQGHRDEWKSTE